MPTARLEGFRHGSVNAARLRGSGKVLLFWAVLVSQCVATQSACSSDPAPKGNLIVVVGDSYTTGPKENSEDPNVWPAMTWKSLRQRGYEIAPTVVGEGGAGYAHPGHLGGTFPEKAQTIQPTTELIVFFGSANDMTVAPEKLKPTVRDTLTKARVTAPNAHMLVIGPAWPRPEPPPEVFRVRDIVRDEAVALGATFVDPLEQRWLWDDPALIGPDGIHPNRAGQEYLAEKIRPLLEAELPTPSH